MSGRTDKYECIINLQPPSSEKHPPMDRLSRAAQFAPFAALTGYEDVIREAGRYTETRPRLSEDMKSLLNARLEEIMSTGSLAKITYFVPDSRKAGGRCCSLTSRLRYDEYRHVLILADGSTVSMDDVIDICAAY